MAPIVFLTSKENEKIASILFEAITRWLQTWCGESYSIQVTRNQDTSVPEAFYFASKNKQIKYDSIGVNFLESLHKLIFSNELEQLPKDNLRKTLLCKAQKSLIDELNKDLKSDDYQKFDSIEGSEFKKFFSYEVKASNGVVLFELAVSELSAEVLLNRYKTANYRSQLHKVIDVLEKEEVNLDVDLDLGKSSITNINKLAPGDILVTDKLLTSTVSLSLNNKPIATSKLGKQQGDKVIIIDEINYDN